eukprot:TRINITY_DN7049_c0_g1_i1.p1 TRINITY_DN7049_c0_g1~~TRINITY_DN7049_c0_g1_i1.p1  ORF type:complete len:674 (+),score=58.26 TRINITY_DN7049_c0_g1_i1:60-2081(+)
MTDGGSSAPAAAAPIMDAAEAEARSDTTPSILLPRPPALPGRSAPRRLWRKQFAAGPAPAGVAALTGRRRRQLHSDGRAPAVRSLSSPGFGRTASAGSACSSVGRQCLPSPSPPSAQSVALEPRSDIALCPLQRVDTESSIPDPLPTHAYDHGAWSLDGSSVASGARPLRRCASAGEASAQALGFPSRSGTRLASPGAAGAWQHRCCNATMDTAPDERASYTWDDYMSDPSGTLQRAPSPSSLHMAPAADPAHLQLEPTMAEGLRSPALQYAARRTDGARQPESAWVAEFPGPGPEDSPPLSSSCCSAPAPAPRVALPTRLRWRRGRLLGTGHFGKVYAALNQDTGEIIAAKEIIVSLSRGAVEVQRSLRLLQSEVALLKQLAHPNIVRYLGTSREGSGVIILMEYVPGGSLAALLRQFGPLQEGVVQAYSRQIVSALSYLHRCHVVHRDVKGANVLLHQQGHVKLADFGTAQHIGHDASADVEPGGTPNWMAPEIVRGEAHGSPCDVWSFGAACLEMLTADLPFAHTVHGRRGAVAVMNYVAGDEPITLPPELCHGPQKISVACRDFCGLCLHRAPANRPSALALARHPFLTQPPSGMQRIRSAASLQSIASWLDEEQGGRLQPLSPIARRASAGADEVRSLDSGSLVLPPALQALEERGTALSGTMSTTAD